MHVVKFLAKLLSQTANAKIIIIIALYRGLRDAYH